MSVNEMITPQYDLLLRNSGLKATSQRRALLQLLAQEHAPMTISEIAGKLKSVNQVTVYRGLEMMVEKGLVRRVDTQHPYTHYELVATRKHHHHLSCAHCGMIEDVELCLPKKLEQEVLLRSKNFTLISGHSLEFTGICATCALK